MFVECYKNHGVETLRLVEGKSGISKNGKRTVTKRVILTLGPLHRYDDGQPDYVKRLKQSFVDGNPLIDSLLPYTINLNNPRISYSIWLNPLYELIAAFNPSSSRMRSIKHWA